jgi:hypothetical protein
MTQVIRDRPKSPLVYIIKLLHIRYMDDVDKGALTPDADLERILAGLGQQSIRASLSSSTTARPSAPAENDDALLPPVGSSLLGRRKAEQAAAKAPSASASRRSADTFARPWHMDEGAPGTTTVTQRRVDSGLLETVRTTRSPDGTVTTVRSLSQSRPAAAPTEDAAEAAKKAPKVERQLLEETTTTVRSRSPSPGHRGGAPPRGRSRTRSRGYASSDEEDGQVLEERIVRRSRSAAGNRGAGEEVVTETVIQRARSPSPKRPSTSSHTRSTQAAGHASSRLSAKSAQSFSKSGHRRPEFDDDDDDDDDIVVQTITTRRFVAPESEAPPAKKEAARPGKEAAAEDKGSAEEKPLTLAERRERAEEARKRDEEAKRKAAETERVRKEKELADKRLAADGVGEARTVAYRRQLSPVRKPKPKPEPEPETVDVVREWTTVRETDDSDGEGTVLVQERHRQVWRERVAAPAAKKDESASSSKPKEPEPPKAAKDKESKPASSDAEIMFEVTFPVPSDSEEKKKAAEAAKKKAADALVRESAAAVEETWNRVVRPEKPRDSVRRNVDPDDWVTRNSLGLGPEFMRDLQVTRRR